MLLALAARTTHDKATWRAATSHADLRASMPATLPSLPSLAALPNAVAKRSLVIVSLESNDGRWKAPRVSIGVPRSRHRLGTVDVTAQSDHVRVDLPDDRWSVPHRPGRDLGTVAAGEALVVDVNWRENFTSGSFYTDTTTVIAWPTVSWIDRTVAEVLDALAVRTIDLRAVLG